MSKSIMSRVEALEKQSGPEPVIVANFGESADQAIVRFGNLNQFQREKAIVVHTGVPARFIQDTKK